MRSRRARQATRVQSPLQEIVQRNTTLHKDKNRGNREDQNAADASRLLQQRQWRILPNDQLGITKPCNCATRGFALVRALIICNGLQKMILDLTSHAP